MTHRATISSYNLDKDVSAEHMEGRELDWDQVMPKQMFESWKELKDMRTAVGFSFQRQLVKLSVSCQLDAIADESTLAYRSCIYLILSDFNSVSSLVMAKARVVHL